jgi:hypothetical protein
MKIKTTILLIIGFIVLSYLAKSQTLKTYIGKYEGGEANYQYYENANYERIFQGKFTYAKTNAAADIRGWLKQGIFINGVFKENKKDGLWEGKQVWTSSASNNSSVTSIVKGNYENGLKIGLWTSTQNINKDKKSEVTSYSFNFNNNVLVGAINSKDLEGALDSQGLFIGNWRIINGDEEYIAEFKNNLLMKLICRRMSDGYIFLKYNTPSISKLQSDSIPKIEETSYIIKNVSDINFTNNELGFIQEEHDVYGDIRRNKERYFVNFFNLIFERVRSFDEILKDIHLGSSSIATIPPQVSVIKVITEQEKQQIEETIQKQKEEENRIQEEKIRLEKEKVDAISRKQKFDDAVNNGNKLFNNGKFREALTQYNLANAIESSNSILKNIKATEDEIDKIIRKHKFCYETYAYLWNENSTLMMEWIRLKTSLESKKKVYGDNYEKCMNLLSSKFSSYFSIANISKENITNMSTIEESWDETDQAEFDLLLKYKDDIKACEKFHNRVLEANNTDNNDQLKLLKSSDDPNEIIAKFLIAK